MQETQERKPENSAQGSRAQGRAGKKGLVWDHVEVLVLRCPVGRQAWCCAANSESRATAELRQGGLWAGQMGRTAVQDRGAVRMKWGPVTTPVLSLPSCPKDALMYINICGVYR